MLKGHQKVDIKLSKICQNHQKLSEWQKVCFTLHWNRSQIFFVWRLKKISASFQAICRPLGFSWTRENHQLNINDTDLSSRKQYLGLLTLLALLCCGNSSEFYFLDELYRNELVFVLSFFSSNNTAVETAFYCTRGMLVISLLPTLDTRRKNWYRTLFSSRLASFLAFDPRWILWCFPLKEVSP